MRILVTGAAGQVGGTVARGLRDRHQIRGHDRRPMPGLDDAVVSDLSDFDALLEATRGVDAVAHIGGLPGGDEWEPIHRSNILGTYNVFEACRRNGVGRVAFASRIGVYGEFPRGVTLSVDLVPTPVGFYTISKVFGESIAYSYSREHGMGCVCVRIGSFTLERDQPQSPLHLSHGDCVRVFERALVHPGVSFEVVFGVSDSNWPLYDLDHGRRVIGYYPQDRSFVPEERWRK